MVRDTAADSALVEREPELAAVRPAVDAAVAGRGGVLRVEGPAGIGKTSLLQAARGYASRRGLRVLRTRPGPLERGFAFGVVRGLFEPAVVARPDLLADGPARLAAPVVTLVGPDERAAVTAERLHGLYWLTIALADESPVPLVVDDAHWADEPSLQALDYLARRVEELPVAILLAMRSDLGAAVPDPIGDDEGAVVLRPGPLTRAACDRLAREVLGEATPAFLAACADGNTAASRHRASPCRNCRGR